MTADDLTLSTGQAAISGWTGIRVGRGVERLPSDFSLELTERYPGEANAFVVQPMDPITVKLGSDLVLTGYVDRLATSISAGQHSVTVSGRGKCADLVDCAAIWAGGQISNADVLSIATKLAEPYGITVQSLSGSGLIVPQYNINWGSTVFEIIEMLCRWSGFLVYDGTDGNLILARAGAGKHASGIAQGVNAQSANFVSAADQRFSQFVVRRIGTDTLSDLGTVGNMEFVAQDVGMKRTRMRYIIMETGDYGPIAKQRASWEIARRYGRGNQVRAVLDSWRDSAGQLWTPNQLIDVDLPTLKVAPGLPWLISEVTYLRDEQGTRAELMLMPPQAFELEPVLTPWNAGFGDVLPQPGPPAR